MIVKTEDFFKLSDFGLIGTEVDLCGTHNKYMAPELIDTEKHSSKSDVYSLAVIANQLFGFNNETHSDYM